MVAKSYQCLEQVGEPFVVSGKSYVNVILKSGKQKSVRWYTEKEYKKMYPGEEVAIGSNSTFRKSDREVFGFQKGYITIFTGDVGPEDEFFQRSNARYCTRWGWYVISEEEVPINLPFGVEPVKLAWESVGTGDGKLRDESTIRSAVDTLIYNESSSVFVGTIGERLELDVVVDKVVHLENNYGTTNMYLFSDVAGNVYKWVTQSKNWAEGSQHRIRGTVKDHKNYKGTNQTVLTRCMEVKK